MATLLGPWDLVGRTNVFGAGSDQGVDIDRSAGLLRLEVIPPGICGLFTQVYEYRLAG